MNPFLAHAVATRSRQTRRTNTGRQPKAAVTVTEKRQEEDGKLSQLYHRAVTADRERCYALPQGTQAKALAWWATHKMTPGDGEELIERAKPFVGADPALRFRLLADLNIAIARLRVRTGLAAIEDPLPGEDENVFRKIRKGLGL